MTWKKYLLNTKSKTLWDEIPNTSQTSRTPSNLLQKAFLKVINRQHTLPKKDNLLDDQNKELWKDFQDIPEFWEAFQHLFQQAVLNQRNYQVQPHQPTPPQERKPKIYQIKWVSIKNIFRNNVPKLVVACWLFIILGASWFLWIKTSPTPQKTLNLPKISRQKVKIKPVEKSRTWQGYQANQDFKKNKTSPWSNKCHLRDTSVVIALHGAGLRQLRDSIASHYISSEYVLQALAKSAQRPCNLNKNNEAIYDLFTSNDISLYFIEGKYQVLHRVWKSGRKFYATEKSEGADSINIAQHQLYKAYFTLEQYWLDKPLAKIEKLTAMLYQQKGKQKQFYVPTVQLSDKHFHLEVKPMPSFVGAKWIVTYR